MIQKNASHSSGRLPPASATPPTPLSPLSTLGLFFRSLHPSYETPLTNLRLSPSAEDLSPSSIVVSRVIQAEGAQGSQGAERLQEVEPSQDVEPPEQRIGSGFDALSLTASLVLPLVGVPSGAVQAATNYMRFASTVGMAQDVLGGINQRANAEGAPHEEADPETEAASASSPSSSQNASAASGPGHAGPSSAAAPLVALGLLGMVQQATGESANASSEPKSIDSCSEMEKIGKDTEHPSNATYSQTQSFSCQKSTATAGIVSHDFSGQFNGNAKTISDLKVPLFGNLTEKASVHHVHIDKARITQKVTTSLGALAENAKGNAAVHHIWVSNSEVHAENPNAGVTAGGLFGLLSENATCSDVLVQNTVVTAKMGYSSVGGVIGKMKDQASASNLALDKGYVLSEGESCPTGGAVGYLHSKNATLSSVSVLNSQVIGKSASSVGGVIGASGSEQALTKLNLVNSKISLECTTKKPSIDFPSGGLIGLGGKTPVSSSNVVDSTLSVTGDCSDKPSKLGLLASSVEQGSQYANCTVVNTSGAEKGVALADNAFLFDDKGAAKTGSTNVNNLGTDASARTCTADSFKGSPLHSDCSQKEPVNPLILPGASGAGVALGLLGTAGLGAAAYTGYHLHQGYKEGKTGKDLLLHPVEKAKAHARQGGAAALRFSRSAVEVAAGAASNLRGRLNFGPAAKVAEEELTPTSEEQTKLLNTAVPVVLTGADLVLQNGLQAEPASNEEPGEEETKNL